ncbi:hypothetical protein AMAG_17924 [Allomyces macrogynus ATCC 38327]|uniref:Uncharacterized protein n=1 Tax=Allomyces macrogynus (strain ATCC 38327) TaxID=578462 RepID=A0A0L0S220_ALLM3|nr:hypothetical protein AMAG_17924 [Allomyces macrogynus ATCC 38327]|eukprot:KNE56450.1 hypothetical protein AMAG_17924 [Allomyces macrogynus ATCC 38327]
MTGGDEKERPVNNENDRIEAAWDHLEPKLHARIRYLREVDVVSRGYRLRSERSATPWGADSLRKPNQRTTLAICVGQLLASFITALDDSELTSLISGFAAAGAADSAVPSIQHLRELIDCCTHLAEAVIERANTTRPGSHGAARF